MRIAQNIKYLRELHNMRGKDLADALGVAISTISGYENGNREPSIDVIERMCDIFAVDAHQLLIIDLEKSGMEDSRVEEPTSRYEKKSDAGLWDYRKLVEEVEKLKSIVETLKN